MPSHKGRDLLLKIGDGAAEEVFITLGAARTCAMTLNNQSADATTMADGGIQVLNAAAGLQSLSIRLEGIFKDSAAEEILRGVAFERSARHFKLQFPNGDSYTAPFVVDNYARSGSHDGLESFAVTLSRSGAGTFDSLPAEE